MKISDIQRPEFCVISGNYHISVRTVFPRDLLEAGRYDFVEPLARHYVSNLKVFPIHETDGTFFSFEKDLAPMERIIKMRTAGFQPATVDELLTLGKDYPDLQKERPVVAFGSWEVSNDGLFFKYPVLSSKDGKRSFEYLYGNFTPDIAYLCVPMTNDFTHRTSIHGFKAD